MEPSDVPSPDRDRRLRRAALVVFVLCAVLIAAVGGFGYYTWQDRDELPEELEEARSLVEAMQRDLGLDADEVASVFAEQAEARSTLVDLRETLGEDYGGAEFDLESRELIVSVTDTEAVEEVEDAGA